MTDTQVKYQNHLETVRHDLATEQLATDELQHKKSYDWATLQETTRSHRASEKIETNKLKETKRSNKAREKETKRHDKVTEKEIGRSNRANESIKSRDVRVREVKAPSEIALNVASARNKDASTRKLEVEIDKYDLSLLAKSRNKYVQGGVAAMLAADIIADPSQSAATKAAAQKILDKLGFTDAKEVAEKATDGAKAKVQALKKMNKQQAEVALMVFLDDVITGRISKAMYRKYRDEVKKDKNMKTKATK